MAMSGFWSLQRNWKCDYCKSSWNSTIYANTTSDFDTHIIDKGQVCFRKWHGRMAFVSDTVRKQYKIKPMTDWDGDSYETDIDSVWCYPNGADFEELRMREMFMHWKTVTQFHPEEEPLEDWPVECEWCSGNGLFHFHIGTAFKRFECLACHGDGQFHTFLPEVECPHLLDYVQLVKLGAIRRG